MNKIISELFCNLHQNPEISEKEFKTKKILKDFISNNTNFEIFDLDLGFYCVYHSNNSNAKNIAIRADYDAVANNEGIPFHLCGHDGHAATLCNLALRVFNEGAKNNIYFLFQAAEEKGTGAKGCLDIFSNKIDEIYGQHNLPGYEFGEVYTKKQTFACTSCGMKLIYKGKQSHSAYPEYGISPSNMIKGIIDITNNINCDNPIKLITINGIFMGNKGSGVSGDKAEIYLTLRAETDDSLQDIIDQLINYSNENKNELEFSYETYDYFPPTINNDECYKQVSESVKMNIMDAPIRWSEDFGYYSKKCKSCFIGIGSGLDQPKLHTPEYIYPKELIDISTDIFYSIIKGERK